MLYIVKLGLNISKKILRGVHPTAEMISVHTTLTITETISTVCNTRCYHSQWHLWHRVGVVNDYADTVSPWHRVSIVNDYVDTHFSLIISQNRFCLFIWDPDGFFDKKSFTNLMTRSLYEDDNFKNYLVRIALLSCLGHSTVKLDCFTRRTFVDRFYLKI